MPEASTQLITPSPGKRGLLLPLLGWEGPCHLLLSVFTETSWDINKRFPNKASHHWANQQRVCPQDIRGGI